MTAIAVLQNLASRPLVRRLVDRAMGRYAVHHVASLDHRSAVRQQERTLLRLIRHAKGTVFGREHQFERIRSIDDYQRRVPLRDYESFWSEYWRQPFPFLEGVTWPEAIPYFALSSGTTSGTTKYIPISRHLLGSIQRAGLTSLALFLNAHPGIPLFTGRMFFLGGSTALDECGMGNGEWGKKNKGIFPHSPFPIRHSIRAGDLSGITAVETSPLLRPYTFPPVELALQRDWEKKLWQLAERAAQLPITMLSGVPSWLLVLFDRVKQVTGRNHIADVWPMLRLIFHGGTTFEPYRTLFAREVGSTDVHFFETYAASEGFLAAEDPRYQRLRLLTDHHLFFEFVPVEELGSANPRRHTLANLEIGVQYAVVLTTCAGLWSYVLGDTICFESRTPPLLRFTGRTRYFLSAFGEHLICEEIEKAVAAAAVATNSAVVDFHVGPVFPESPGVPGRHRYLIEFAEPLVNSDRFASELDAALGKMNEDYAAHRQGDLTMLAPEVRVVRRGGFADWMRAQGKLGGQHKVPRMDNSGVITSQMEQFFSSPMRQNAGEPTR
jgi:hypothetical protein